MPHARRRRRHLDAKADDLDGELTTRRRQIIGPKSAASLVGDPRRRPSANVRVSSRLRPTPPDQGVLPSARSSPELG
jgi:hypothetical protein